MLTWSVLVSTHTHECDYACMNRCMGARCERVTGQWGIEGMRGGWEYECSLGGGLVGDGVSRIRVQDGRGS